MKKVAIWNRLIVKVDPIENKLSKQGNTFMTKGGIALPEKNSIAENEARRQEGNETGVVMAIGPHAYEGQDHPIRLGDRVCFKRYAGADVTLPSDPKEVHFRCMEDLDVLCKLEEDK